MSNKIFANLSDVLTAEHLMKRLTVKSAPIVFAPSQEPLKASHRISSC